MFKKTQTKLLAFYSSWIACILIILAGAFYFLLSNSFTTSVSQQLERSTKQIQQSLSKLPRIQVFEVQREKMNVKSTESDQDSSTLPPLPAGMEKSLYFTFLPYNHFFYLFSPDGTMVAHSLRDEALWSKFRYVLPTQSAAGDREITVDSPQNHAFTLVEKHLADGSTLYVGMEVTENRQFLHRMKWILLFASGAMLLLSVAVGYRFSSSAMVPILNAYRRQQEFVADASHEIRTPLSIIRASAEILEEEKAEFSPFHQTLVTGMKSELQRMTELLDSLLTLARSDSGSLELNRRPFDFDRLAQMSAMAFQQLAAGLQVEVEVSRLAPETEWFYSGDEERLRQLLYILLDNAVKYNRPGGRVILEYNMTADSLDISVDDTGIGIPAGELPSVFERFYRVDKARARSTGGHGLGLAIAAWIVQAHGGNIQVGNRTGGGTTINVSLPLVHVR